MDHTASSMRWSLGTWLLCMIFQWFRVTWSCTSLSMASMNLSWSGSLRAWCRCIMSGSADVANAIGSSCWSCRSSCSLAASVNSLCNCKSVSDCAAKDRFMSSLLLLSLILRFCSLSSWICLDLCRMGFVPSLVSRNCVDSSGWLSGRCSTLMLAASRCNGVASVLLYAFFLVGVVLNCARSRQWPSLLLDGPSVTVSNNHHVWRETVVIQVLWMDLDQWNCWCMLWRWSQVDPNSCPFDPFVDLLTAL